MNVSSGDSISGKFKPQPVQPNVPAVSDGEFKAMLAQAKGRLSDPLGTLGTGSSLSGMGATASQGAAAPADPSQTLASGIMGGASTSDDVDSFSGVDAMNQRVFSEIYSTIQTRLDQLKQVQAAKESGVSASKGMIAKSDIDNLYMMASKVAEIYGTSESVEYKKKADKTLVRLITKLAAQAEMGNAYAAQRLHELGGKFSPDSVPGIVLSSYSDDPKHTPPVEEPGAPPENTVA
jgi:hypothetical protein